MFKTEPYAFASCGQCFGAENLPWPPLSFTKILKAEPGENFEFFKMVWDVRGEAVFILKLEDKVLGSAHIGPIPSCDAKVFAEPLVVRSGQQLSLEIGAARPMSHAEACIVLWGRRLKEEG